MRYLCWKIVKIAERCLRPPHYSPMMNSWLRALTMDSLSCSSGYPTSYPMQQLSQLFTLSRGINCFLTTEKKKI